MTYTLSNLLVDTLAETGRLLIRTAAAGTANTIVDNGLIEKYQEEDWKNGIAIIIGNGESPPEGEFASISGFDPQTGTFTLDQNLSEAVVAGCRYGVVSGKFPLEIIIKMINRGLNRLGKLALCEEVVLAGLKAENHILSIDWNHPAPTSLEFCLSTGEWRKLYDWYYIPPTNTSTGIMRVRIDPAAISEIRIWYRGRHPKLTAFSDVISPNIPEELAVAAAVERCLHWQYYNQAGSDPVLGMMWKESQQELFHLCRRMPLLSRPRQARLHTSGAVQEIQGRRS